MRREGKNSNGSLKKCPECMKELQRQYNRFTQNEDGTKTYMGQGYVQEKLLNRLKTTRTGDLHRLCFNKLHKAHSHKPSLRQKNKGVNVMIEV
jgi:hypothetical protein